MFTRILIANRGEIALRIIRAARELGIETVCVYSQADADGPWLQFADETICIGPGPATESYLRIDRIISAAEIANVADIHPGSIEDEPDAIKLAAEIGYPVSVKAAAGGGGRGMRIARNEAALRAAIGAAAQEAEAAFGNPAVYVEKFLEHARHVEIQVLGDKHGGAVHLFERDCTTQRRHQKLIEEAPAPRLDPRKRETVAKSAVELIRRAEYAGAATVEFLMDQDQNFYMLEVNTRVQVEHPVTEMVTGIDIVKTMIRIAAGEPLPFKQRDVTVSGHAIECRINAEDPDRGFIPQPGLVTEFAAPGGLGVRLDSHMRSGYRIPPDYDSMIAKLIVHGRDRDEAIARMRGALDEFAIGPIKTTIGLHRRLMDQQTFIDADFDIHYLERLLRAAGAGEPVAP